MRLISYDLETKQYWAEDSVENHQRILGVIGINYNTSWTPGKNYIMEVKWVAAFLWPHYGFQINCWELKKKILKEVLL